MTTFTVTNLNDSGAGSLRAAITAADADPSASVIDFTVGGTITLASALPSVTQNVTIDATTAPGFVSGGPPVVEIDCNGQAGLVFDTGSDGSQLLGVAVDNASGNGVTLNAGSITLNFNYIGLDLTGAASGNSGDGVFVAASSANNLIGVKPTSMGGNAADPDVFTNVISGNGGNGISFHGSSGNTVVANRIGTNATGTAAIANGGNGIWITGGSTGNTIGGQAYIDSVSGRANNPTGTEGSASPTFVVPPLGNLISGNGQAGVLIDANSQNNVLSGNFIGTNLDGDAAIGNAGDGVWINGADNNSLIGTLFLNPPGTPNAGTLNRTPFTFYNVVSGNGASGLEVTNSNNVTVQANFFGVGANNASLVPNTRDGILIDGSSQNTVVGGVIPLGNVTSGNGLNGIEVSGTVSGFVSFNTFGGGLAFGPAAPNGNDGILITADDSSGAGANVLQTNVFSGNANNGIELAGNASGAEINPNIVGLTTAGNAPLPNGGDGLLITGTAHDNIIGGPVPLPPAESVIPNQAFSGNAGYGIAIVGQAYNNLVEPFNFVGTGVSGLGPPVNPILGNGAGGILVGGAAHDNTIGGAQGGQNHGPNEGNLISGNTGNGITLLSTGNNNVVFGNTIGVDQIGVRIQNTGSPILQFFDTGTFAGTAALVGQSMVSQGGPTFPQSGGELVLAEVGGTSSPQPISLSQTTVPGGQMGPEWNAVAMADFNGDGNSDALWYAASGADAGQVAIWELNGPNLIGFGVPAGQMGTEWQPAATGDFSGDGDSDILWHAESGPDAGQVAVWTLNGTTLVGAGISTGEIGVEWTPVATGDFFGTGRSAVLWQSDTGAVQDWSLDGTNVVAAATVGQVGPEWRVAGVGQFNGIGSGDPTGDIVWVDDQNHVQIWQMTNGQIAQIVSPESQMGLNWTLQGVGDYTGSGNSELLWLNSSGQSVIWQLNGAQVTQSTIVANQSVGAGDTIVNPVITDNTLQLASGAIVQGSITFAAGGSGSLFDADQANQPDTVIGFDEGSNHLMFAGQNATTEAAVITSAQSAGGNTVLTFPDHTSIVLVGVSHVDAGIFG